MTKQRKTLYIHIGHYKTGTTALQVFLNSNQKALTKNKVEYVKTYRENVKHSLLAFSILKAVGATSFLYGYKDPVNPLVAWRKILDEVSESKANSFIVSSEEFARLGGFLKAKTYLSQIRALANERDINVKIILYIRDPITHMRSWYNQIIKMNFKCPPFENVFSYMEKVHYDYRTLIATWVEVFEEKNVLVNEYIKSSNTQWLYHSFLSTINVPSTKFSDFEYPDKLVNPRMDDGFLDFLRLTNNTFDARTTNSVKKNVDSFLTESNFGMSLLEKKPDDSDLQNGLKSIEDAKTWLTQAYPNLHFAKEKDVVFEQFTDNTVNRDAFIYSELVQLRRKVGRLEKEVRLLKKEIKK